MKINQILRLYSRPNKYLEKEKHKNLHRYRFHENLVDKFYLFGQK